MSPGPRVMTPSVPPSRRAWLYLLPSCSFLFFFTLLLPACYDINRFVSFFSRTVFMFASSYGILHRVGDAEMKDVTTKLIIYFTFFTARITDFAYPLVICTDSSLTSIPAVPDGTKGLVVMATSLKSVDIGKLTLPSSLTTLVLKSK